MKHQTNDTPVQWKNLLTACASLIALILFSDVTLAQSLQIPGTIPDEEVVITNAVIHTVSDPSPLARGYVAFHNGTITAVGAGDYPGDPRGRIVIDATGYHVYPGLIASSTSIGLVEIDAVRATQDTSEVGNITPEVVAVTAVNPDSAIIPVTRSNGILHALVVPEGGLISGYASVIRLDGWTTEDLVVRKRAGLVVNWPNVQPRPNVRTDKDRREFRERADESIEQVENLFNEATAYLALRRNDPADQPVDLRLESLAPVLENECPIFIRAGNAATIRSALAWCSRRNLDVVLVASREVDQCIDLLKENNIPVIITGIHQMPSRRDRAYDEPFTLANTLHDEGIRFAIASGTGGAASERNLPYHAGCASAYGLPKQSALESITLSAAEILGIGETHGSINVGKSADLVITDGDPLEMSTVCIAAWIHGAPVDLNDKHKSLNEKYRTRYGLPHQPPK